MSNRLGGRQGTAYLGTNAAQPPNWTFDNRPPNQYDTQNVSVGDFWLDRSAQGLNRVWILVSLAGNDTSKGSLAQWEQFNDSSVINLESNTGGPIPPTAGIINIVGDGTTIMGSGNAGTSTITLSTAGTVATEYIEDNGTAIPSGGILNIITNNTCGSSVSTIGLTNNVILALTDDNNNITLGTIAGNSTITGTDNVSLGANTLHLITSGTTNTALGSQSLKNMTTGSYNISLGYLSAANYTTSESSNIIIGNVGTLGESNTIRIGVNGSSSGQQNACYIAGIYNDSFDASSEEMVVIDNTNKLGSTSLAAQSWTPTLSFGNASVGITYAVQEGIYQSIGKIVFYSGSISLSSKGTSTGDARVVGLPFNSAGTFQTQFGPLAIGNITLGSGNTYAWCINDIGTNKLLLSASGSGATQILLDDTAFADNSAISFTGFYFET